MTLSDPIKVLLRVTGVLEKLDVPYLAGGSIASSYYGMARPTQDVDVVAALTLDHVERFVAELGADFYVDAAMIREAIRNRGSFNVILLETMDKADLFLMSPTPWCREEMLRRRREFPDPEQPERSVCFATPEDVVLHKLLWYQEGGGVSTRQWGDILGVLQVQGEHLDLHYMEHWAGELGVTDLLILALAQSECGRKQTP